MAVISSACLHSMAAANSHMPAWPAPALAARPGRLHLLLWTLTLDRPLVTHTELYRLTAQPAAEQDTAHSDPPATNPPPGVCPGISVMCTFLRLHQLVAVKSALCGAYFLLHLSCWGASQVKA